MQESIVPVQLNVYSISFSLTALVSGQAENFLWPRVHLIICMLSKDVYIYLKKIKHPKTHDAEFSTALLWDSWGWKGPTLPTHIHFLVSYNICGGFLCKHDKHKMLGLQGRSPVQKSKNQVAWIHGVSVILIYNCLGIFTSVLLQIQILCEADHLKVAVDDAHLMQYNHRIKELNQITKLSISGDVTLTSVMPVMI